jgi:D-proline dehydrogenase
MQVAVVGGGIAGLFTAYYLERGGAEVTVLDERAPGDRSVHAAGIIEPTTAYRTNTLAFVRRVWRLWRRRTCTFRSVDPRWLAESARQLEREPLPSASETLLRMGRASLATYAALAATADDFGFSPGGLLERFDDPRHFDEQRQEALAQQAETPVEVREGTGDAGALYFPGVAWVHTERFVQRMLRELPRTRFLRERAMGISLDGAVRTEGGSRRYDRVAVCTGVSSRTLGVPLTAVRGYGWHVRAADPPEVATIYVDRGIAVVPFAGDLKVTGGWDFDLAGGLRRPATVLGAVRKVLDVREVVAANDGARPCTPDGLPTVGRKGSVVVANGGFRLGWSFAPAMGEEAARLCLDRSDNDPFLARFCAGLRSGRFA